MKVCPNCNTSYPDDSVFCPVCGSQLVAAAEPAPAPAADPAPAPEVAPAEPAPAEPNGPSAAFAIVAKAKALPKKTWGIIGGAVAAIVVIIILCCALGGGGYEATVKAYFKAIENGDAEANFELQMPKNIVEEAAEDDFGFSYKELVKVYSSLYGELVKVIKKEVGALTVEYEIKAAESINNLDKLEDDSRYDDVDDFADMLEEDFEDYGFSASKVKDVYAVKVKYKVAAGKEKITSDTKLFYLYNYSGDWYVYNAPIDLDSIVSYITYNDEFEDVMEEYYDIMEDLMEDYEDLF